MLAPAPTEGMLATNPAQLHRTEGLARVQRVIEQISTTPTSRCRTSQRVRNVTADGTQAIQCGGHRDACMAVPTPPRARTKVSAHQRSLRSGHQRPRRLPQRVPFRRLFRNTFGRARACTGQSTRAEARDVLCRRHVQGRTVSSLLKSIVIPPVAKFLRSPAANRATPGHLPDQRQVFCGVEQFLFSAS